MSKFISNASGATSMQMFIDAAVKNGEEAVKDMTPEDVEATKGIVEILMNRGFTNGVLASAITVCGVAIGYGAVKLFDFIKKKKAEKKSNESEEEA